MTIEQFASEYHDMRSANGDDPKPVTLAGLGPFPKLRPKDECPDIIHWLRDHFLTAMAAANAAQQKGKTDGNATTVKTKAKAGWPPKKSQNNHHHIYLERADGTLISTSELQHLSQKACSVWLTLAVHKHAPKTWGRLSSFAWEYFARTMLNEPGLEFLQFCDDGQWKLREWSQQSYSGWARNHGIREQRPKKLESEKTSALTDVLDDPELICMKPDDDQDRTSIENKSDGDDSDNNSDSNDSDDDSDDENPHRDNAETSGGSERDNTSPGENPHPPTGIHPVSSPTSSAAVESTNVLFRLLELPHLQAQFL